MSVEKLDFQKVTREQIPYTLVSTKVIQNIKDPLAGFIWVYLSSLPPDWKIIKQHIKNHFGIGDSVLKRIFSYLKKSNLIEYIKVRDEQGVIQGWGLNVLCGDKFEMIDKSTGSESKPMDIHRVNNPPGGERRTTKEIINTNTTSNNSSMPSLDIPDWISKQDWIDFLQHRKDIKKPMNIMAQKRAITILAKLKEQGQDVSEVINHSIVNGWTGLFAINRHSQKGKSNGSGSKTSQPNHCQSVTEKLRQQYLNSLRREQTKRQQTKRQQV